MAKSARASQIKANNQRLKKNVFGPVEQARAERLSAKLLEIAAQPKPVKEVEMEEVTEGMVPLSIPYNQITNNHADANAEAKDAAAVEKDECELLNIKRYGYHEIDHCAAMEVDSGAKPAAKASSKGRIEKRRNKKKSSIVFPKYGERKNIKKRK